MGGSLGLCTPPHPGAWGLGPGSHKPETLGKSQAVSFSLGMSVDDTVPPVTGAAETGGPVACLAHCLRTVTAPCILVPPPSLPP